MRLLLDRETGRTTGSAEMAAEDLAVLYAAPRSPWLRVNMVSTVDGAATGADGKSKSINNEADKTVFDLLRTLADAVVVGAGTIRTEGYAPMAKPCVVVSRRGEVPEQFVDQPKGPVYLVTCAQADGLIAAREALGEDQVLVLGDDSVDLTRLKPALAERGLVDLLSEGGPHLLRDMLAAGVVDELTFTQVPRLVAGEHLRITAGEAVDLALDLRVLLEQDGTLLGRWFPTPAG